MIDTKTNLIDESTDAVQKLIEINADSSNGFKQAADKLENIAIANLFTELSSQRVAQAVELRKLISPHSQEPITERSIAAPVHRAVMDWRSALERGDRAVLKAAERGEDYLKAKYEEVLKKTAGSAVTEVLNRQYAAVQTAHERIGHLLATCAD